MARESRIRVIQRHGTTSLELLVSFTLLATVLSVATPLIIRHGRLLTSHRDYQLALDELSNQLERLTALPADKLPQAVKELTPSALAAEKLPDAKLTGELKEAEMGQQLILRLTWKEPQRQAPPVQLAAWIYPQPSPESQP